MLSKIHHPVIRLHRCNFAGLELEGVAKGSWRELTDREVQILKSGGIPPKLLPVLFSGTLRHSDTPTGDGKRNMGLGLSVCNAIVRAHGGTMHAQNKDGGAEFIFCLPMIEKEPELQ